MSAGGHKGDDPQLKNVGISAALADEVDRFISQHPGMGIKFRNEFANRACAHYLDHMRQQLLRSMMLDEWKEGKSSVVDALRQLGLRPERD